MPDKGSAFRKTGEGTMELPLKSSERVAMEESFFRMVELSRTTAPAILGERLDRLARLRQLLSQNELRFEQAISADFGHRCQTETAVAETLFVLGEIRHATKHLKSW